MIEYLVNFVDFRRRSLQKLKRAWFLLACTILINFVDFRRRSLQKLKRAWFLLACTKILPRRRGSGSDEVDDEGVETSGKAESRKKKVEIAKRIIACNEQRSTSSALVIRLMLVPLRRGIAIFAYTKSLQNAYPCTHTQRGTIILLCFIPPNNCIKIPTITKKGLSF